MSVGMLMSGMLRLTNMPMPTPFLVLMEVGMLVEVWLLVPVGVLLAQGGTPGIVPDAGVDVPLPRGVHTAGRSARVAEP